jgi:hypothetical protein
MSDFFHNLVTRSRAPLDVVRPRTPSMFEPVAPALTAGMDGGPLEEHEESVVAPAPGRRNRPAAPSAIPETGETIGPLEPRRDASDSAEAPHVWPSVPAPRIPPASSETPAAVPVTQRPDSLLIERVIRDASPAREAAPASPPSGPSPAAAREIREIFRDRETRIERQFHHTSATASGVPLQAPLRERLIQPLMAAQPKGTRAEPQPSVPQPSQPAEPVIHVSIGRIEVRAVNETPRGRTEKQARPAMSLDEYLRSRERGAAR